jgi:hypothetical protein
MNENGIWPRRRPEKIIKRWPAGVLEPLEGVIGDVMMKNEE